MPEITPETIMEAVTELRSEVEKSAPDQEKLEKLHNFLDTQEKLNEENKVSLKDAVTREAELKERIEAMEIEVARGNVVTEKNYKDSAEYKALNLMAMKGSQFLDAEQKQLLRTDNDVSGGYLVMGEMNNVIIKQIEEISAIRSISSVRTIASKTLEMPIRTKIPVAAYEGETESSPTDTSNYGSETLTAFRQAITIPITKNMLMDANFDMQSEILSDASESFAVGEGKNFVNGDGVKKPFGFLQDTRVTSNALISGTSATITADDMLKLTGELKTGYNPTYVFNRKTLAFLRTLKSTDGNFLWQPGMNGLVANTINGFPYLSAIDMQDIASNSLSVAFGDFKRGYQIVDRTGVAVVRDELTQKKKAIVEFEILRWNTGQVVLPEAIKLLKTLA